ncbi:hypothetical protein [Rhodococcus sp. 14-2470-1a]|uniref:Gp37-like protein n=1 Tax=Rhodococcus sp. 14-2470-1a TaxID=2023150 RepID=UPI00117A4C84|nr:hypothetical protein [Rhodococcus sp. 14-2470-1a]
MSRQAFAAFQQEAADERKLYGNPRARVRMMTKMMETFAPCNDRRDLTFTDKENAAGGLSFKVPENDTWVEYFYGQAKYAVRPIVIELPGYKTLWFITSFGRVREGRRRWIQIEAVHCLEHFNWLRIFPDAFLPPEFQPSKWSLGLGGACSVLAGELMSNLIRTQANLWSIPTGNLFALSTWNYLRNAFWPMIVNPRNKGLADGSKWATTTARMDKFMDLATEVCATTNVSMRADLWEPGDPQPFPEFTILDRATLVFDFVERGPRLEFGGNIVSGFIRTVVEAATDALEWITYPILGANGWDEYVDRDSLDGTLAGRPLALYRTGQYSTVGRVEQMTHIPMATRATGGGKSPTWINDIAVNSANFVTGLIGQFFGFPGLSLGIFTDRVKDVAFAFHSVEDLRAANEAGPWRFRETFVASEGTGLSLNTFASMWSSLYAVRGYESTAIEVVNGSPYYIGLHIKKGDPVAYEKPNGGVAVDHIAEVTYAEAPNGVGRFTLQIGDGAAEQEPGAIALGKIRKLGSTITRVALGG